MLLAQTAVSQYNEASNFGALVKRLKFDEWIETVVNLPLIISAAWWKGRYQRYSPLCHTRLLWREMRAENSQRRKGIKRREEKRNVDVSKGKWGNISHFCLLALWAELHSFLSMPPPQPEGCSNTGFDSGPKLRQEQSWGFAHGFHLLPNYSCPITHAAEWWLFWEGQCWGGQWLQPKDSEWLNIFTGRIEKHQQAQCNSKETLHFRRFIDERYFLMPKYCVQGVKRNGTFFGSKQQ